MLSHSICPEGRDGDTIIFRHFDQVKRVEKSPEAKQYYTTTFVLSALLSIDFAFFLYSLYLSPTVFYHIYSTHLISSQSSSLLNSFIRFTLQRLHFLTTHLLSLFPSTNCPIFITHSHYSQSVLSLHPSFLSPHYFYHFHFYLSLL